MTTKNDTKATIATPMKKRVNRKEVDNTLFIFRSEETGQELGHFGTTLISVGNGAYRQALRFEPGDEVFIHPSVHESIRMKRIDKTCSYPCTCEGSTSTFHAVLGGAR